ncbi:MAG TPA: BMP family ABC transporter substrate-binding protein [Conexibacter sp.]|jgi:basic membrane protein A
MSHARNTRRTALGAAAAMAISLGVVACGSSGSDSGTTSSGGGSSTSSSSGGQREVRLGAALIGPKNDKSFSEAAYDGIVAAQRKNPGLDLTATLENKVTDQERTDAVETLAPINNVVLGVSASFGPIFDVEAPKFPNTYFVTVSAATEQFHRNVTGFSNDWGAPLYVAGVIAARMTRSGTIGYVGGAEIPPTTQGAAGFIAGAHSVDPSIRVLKNITGDFNDVAKAKAATAAMLSDGADVVFPFLDAGIAGAYSAGRESGRDPAMFKLTIPDCTSYDNIVGTALVNNELATDRMLTQYMRGVLRPGAIFIDLQDPAIQTLQLCPRYRSDATVADATKSTIEAINDGSTRLPASALNPRPDYPWREGFDGTEHNAAATG